MGWIHDLRFRLRALRDRRKHEQQLEEELRFHLEMEIEQRMAAGAERAEAERAARLAFGPPPAVKEACRDAWGTRAVHDLTRDLRGAFRRLAKEPRHSAIVSASLALGIGAVALIFTMVDAVLLEPLPFGEPERVVAFLELTPAGERFSTSDANLLDFRERVTSLSDMAAIRFPQPRPALLVEGERARLSAMVVTPSFFEVLGVKARFGRTFDPGPDGLGSASPSSQPRQVVVSHGAWSRLFGANAGLVGEEIDLDGELWTVIGVLPRSFRYGLSIPDVFLPYVPDPAFPRGDHRLDAVARLAPGVSLARARQEAVAVAERLGAEDPETNGDWSVDLVAAEDFLLGDAARRRQLVLLGAA
ncbi:MAG: ABC transporter permease, partial [Holophagales bacterium]|nr:ABC transporter permease [Holophagales bacterium]